MSETQIIGMLVGAAAGFVLSLIIVAPRWRYLGGGYAYSEGGMSNLGGCVLEIVMTGIGALFGLLVGGLL